MHFAKAFILMFFLMVSGLPAMSSVLEGNWLSDCQNLPENKDGYYSLRPIDTFTHDGKARLRVHVFEKQNCTGKEWDHAVIECTYQVGPSVPLLADTSELDLLCDLNGVTVAWFEIVEHKTTTLRFGNYTGTKPELRPKQLGNVIYRKLSHFSEVQLTRSAL